MSFTRGIDLKKLKIKHLLGIHKELNSYPDSSDIMYYMVETVSAKSEKDAYLFSDDVIGRRFEIEQAEAKEMLEELCSLGYLEHFKKTNIKDVYQLVHNPYT